MDLTLDYNTELYPLKSNESFSLVLASSLVRGVEGGATNGTDGADEEADTHIWRPDGKGRRGLEEDYEYVMYGRVRASESHNLFYMSLTTLLQVYKFDGGTAEIV